MSDLLRSSLSRPPLNSANFEFLTVIVLKFDEQDLKNEENSEKAVECLNEMITNSLLHAEDSLAYLSGLRNHAILRACAIPQV